MAQLPDSLLRLPTNLVGAAARRFRRRASLPLAFALVAACSSSAAAQPVLVENAAEPAAGVLALDATELWRVGGYGESDADFLGWVSDVVVDEQGHTYLLDAQLHEVKAFDESGDHLVTFGRQGEGPGELMRPRGLLIMPDGKIGVLNGRPTRISLFGRDGSIEGDARIGDGETMGFVMNAAARNGHLAVERSVFTMKETSTTTTRTLATIDPDGSIAHVFAEKTSTQPLEGGRRGIRLAMRTEDFVHAWALGPDGRVYVVPSRDRYEIEVYGPDGNHERTIQRAYEPVRRSDEELADLQAQSDRMAERFGSQGFEVFENHPDIDRVLVRDDGELWVRPSEGTPGPEGGSIGTFDVFDPEGRFARQVEVRVPFTPGRDEFTLHGDRLYVVEESVGAMRNAMSGMGMVIEIAGQDEEEDEGEPEPLTVVCYRLGAGSGR